MFQFSFFQNSYSKQQVFQIFQWILEYNHQITSTKMLHPTTRWAQRKDRVFIQVLLMDITNEKVDLTPTHLTFNGQSGQKQYEFSFELFGEVSPELSKWHKTGFHMLFVLYKKDKKTSFWPRLIKSTHKDQHIQIDWGKWVDEDEEQDDPNKGLAGFDPEKMKNFGNPYQNEGDLDDLGREEGV